MVGGRGARGGRWPRVLRDESWCPRSCAEVSDFDTLKRKAVRVVRYRGTNKVETVHELSGKRGYAVGFNGLIDYLRRVLPHSEVIDSALRTEVNEFPDLAVRELVANALIHQHFGVTGA